jgi:outer membrane protein insertion porin family
MILSPKKNRLCLLAMAMLLIGSTVGYGQYGNQYNAAPQPNYQPAPSQTYQQPAQTYQQPPQQVYQQPSGQTYQTVPQSPYGSSVPLGPPTGLGNTGLPDPYSSPQPYSTYQGPRVRDADLVIDGYPARTGRIMLGGAVNSDAGVTGQLTIDERNFDITRWPRSFQDLASGTAFRGAGQTFRIEMAPGTAFKRYTASFVDPNLFGYLPISMSVSGFLYDRRFNDWDEERLGGRLAFGYRITPDLSISAGISGQNVEINTNRTGPAALTNVIGDNTLYSGEIALTHDTRNSPIQASEGHYFEFKFEEAFGDFNYARFETEFRQYWLVSERADKSGKQTISYSTQVGFSGEETPIFENFFAGGYATLRGFDFRGASPVDPINGVETGGRFQWLNSVEYMFPITADDAFRGVAFVDFGTVEDDIKIDQDNFRVAPGLGIRVAIPMLGPAPLAFDFAVPVAKAATDDERLFSFYMSLIR